MGDALPAFTVSNGTALSVQRLGAGYTGIDAHGYITNLAPGPCGVMSTGHVLCWAPVCFTGAGAACDVPLTVTQAHAKWMDNTITGNPMYTIPYTVELSFGTQRSVLSMSSSFYTYASCTVCAVLDNGMVKAS